MRLKKEETVVEKISRRNFIGQNAVGARGHDQEGKRVAGQNFYEKLRGFPAAEKAKILAVQPEVAAPGAAFSLNNHFPTDYARY